MALKFSLWTFLTTALCLVAPSVGEIHSLSITPDSIQDEKDTRYALLPRVLSLARKIQERGHRSSSDRQRILKLLSLLEQKTGSGFEQEHVQKKRKFPEIDSRGFDEDIFDEGFGDWSPMKRW